MLRIKPGVNIDILERYGFKPKYDEDTGLINAFVKKLEEKEYLGLTVIHTTIKKRIRIFKKSSVEWRINVFDNYFDVDTLYDLIQAGLVEKVEE